MEPEAALCRTVRARPFIWSLGDQSISHLHTKDDNKITTMHPSPDGKDGWTTSKVTVAHLHAYLHIIIDTTESK